MQQFLGFLLAALLITATPGPDNPMVLGMGISKGCRQGIAFGLGCAFLCLSHTTLAAIGVNAIRSSGAVKVENVKAAEASAPCRRQSCSGCPATSRVPSASG